MHIHNVFFSLKDNSDIQKQNLIRECYQYLSGLPGIVSFHCGLPAQTCNRPVNDRDFDVGLHVIFEDVADHDEHQSSPQHDEFVGRNRKNLENSRVFDTTAVQTET